MPDDKNSSPLRGGDDEMHKPGDEGDSDSYFFDAGEGAAIDDRVSFFAVPKSEQSGQYGRRYGRAHDTWSNKFPHLRNNNAATKPVPHVHLDDQEWVDPTPIHATSPNDALVLFSSTTASSVGAPAPMMGKTNRPAVRRARSEKKCTHLYRFRRLRRRVWVTGRGAQMSSARGHATGARAGAGGRAG